MTPASVSAEVPLWTSHVSQINLFSPRLLQIMVFVTAIETKLGQLLQVWCTMLIELRMLDHLYTSRIHLICSWHVPFGVLIFRLLFCLLLKNFCLYFQEYSPQFSFSCGVFLQEGNVVLIK